MRVVVNGSQIYYLDKKKPVVIPVSPNHHFVASDGFHHTKPLKLANPKKQTYYFKVGCIIEDDQLIFGVVLLAIIYAMGFTSNILFIKLLSFIPVIYFIYLYYVNRKKFLQIRSE